MIDHQAIQEILDNLPWSSDGANGDPRHEWMIAQSIDPSIEAGIGRWAMEETADDVRNVHEWANRSDAPPVAVLRLAVQAGAYELGFIVGWLARAKALDEALALLAEAYPGESPTNEWRARVEALGAWPV